MLGEIERINRILDEVGRRDGVQGLRLGPEGTGGLMLKNRERLCFEYVHDSRTLFLYIELMPFPREGARKLALFEAMLAANHFGSGDGEGTVAIFRHTGQAVYQIGLNAENLNADQLDRAIDTVLERRGEILFQIEQAKNGARPAAKNEARQVGTVGRLAQWRGMGRG